MSKKAEGQNPLEIVPSPGAIVEAANDFSDLIANLDLTPADRRRVALQRLGKRGVRTKYASKEERKAAQKVRSKTRRQEQMLALPPELRPQPKVKRSLAQKQERRRERGKEKRDFLKEMARANPEQAAKYGIRVDLFAENKPKRKKKDKKNRKKKT